MSTKLRDIKTLLKEAGDFDQDVQHTAIYELTS